MTCMQIQYMKAHAYRVKPLKAKGNLSVDGESFPFEEYQVDVHKGLGTFLSLYGHYVSSFKPRIPKEE
jgi:sphingosine kinase